MLMNFSCLPINLAGDNEPVMDFDLAYAQRTSTDNDKLEVFASADCGDTWQLVYSNSGSSMVTEFTPLTSPFTPADAMQWRRETAVMTGMNQPEVLVKFVTTSDKGNNLYIDNVNLVQKNPVGIANRSTNMSIVSIYPNPANNQTQVSINSQTDYNSNIIVTNALGQVVFEKPGNGESRC
jgi:hypothetical protein